MDEHEKFRLEVADNIAGLAGDKDLQELSRLWTRDVARHKWSYNFSWLGRPAIQFPNDAWAMQELIWAINPSLIIETGIAHGGSLIFYASMLALLDMCEALNSGKPFEPKTSARKVLGIDIDIRAHNRSAIEAHPMSNWIQMIQGSSIAQEVVSQAKAIAKDHARVMVCLDSNHTHDHVLAELYAYAPLVSMGSYCVVFDTIVEDMPAVLSSNRPWAPGNNPKTAVFEYLRRLKTDGFNAGDGAPLHFEIDKSIENKLLITVAPDGYLKRVV